MKRVTCPPNSASLDAERKQLLHFFKLTNQSIPTIMIVSQLRATIASEIRKNSNITNPRVCHIGTTIHPGAAVAVIVYDITNPDSFNKAQYGVKELQKHGSHDIVMALVGNKADLHEKREVPAQDGLGYSEKQGMFFIETSTKTADNIKQLFEETPKRLPQPSSL